MLVGIVVAVCVAVHLSFHEHGYTLLAAGFLGVALGRYFLPTWYKLDADGAAARFLGRTRRLPWREVKRLLVHREGLHLSPFESPSRLDSFHGLFLRFAGKALKPPQAGQPAPAERFIAWHRKQVFREPARGVT